MKLVQFGGPVGNVYDPTTRLILHPSFTGEAMLPPEYPDEFLPSAAACLTKHTRDAIDQAFAQGNGHPKMGPVPPWKAEFDAALAAAGAELRAPLRLGSFNVMVSEQDRAALTAAKQGAAPPPNQPPPAGVAPMAATLPAGMPPPVVSPPPAPPAPASGSKLPFLIGGGFVLLVILGGVTWHFTHSHTAPPVHEHDHDHGKAKH